MNNSTFDTDASLDVCSDNQNHNAKPCADCGTMFAFTRSTAKFCSDACRMKAAAKRESEQRMRRRNYRYELLNRDRAVGFDGKHTGPIRDGVPALSEIALWRFKAVLHV